MSAPWALLSYLLRYPDAEVAAAGPALRAEIAALPDGPVRDALGRFMADWSGDATALAARYVETFDLRRRAALELTYYAHGDTRERGMALLRLKKLYRAAGLPLAGPELPDHLTVMLAFAALAPEGHGRRCWPSTARRSSCCGSRCTIWAAPTRTCSTRSQRCCPA